MPRAGASECSVTSPTSLAREANGVGARDRGGSGVREAEWN